MTNRQTVNDGVRDIVTTRGGPSRPAPFRNRTCAIRPRHDGSVKIVRPSPNRRSDGSYRFAVPFGAPHVTRTRSQKDMSDFRVRSTPTRSGLRQSLCTYLRVFVRHRGRFFRIRAPTYCDVAVVTRRRANSRGFRTVLFPEKTEKAKSFIIFFYISYDMQRKQWQ